MIKRNNRRLFNYLKGNQVYILLNIIDFNVCVVEEIKFQIRSLKLKYEKQYDKNLKEHKE